MPELKPCPFCGKYKDLQILDHRDYFTSLPEGCFVYFMNCPDCGANGSLCQTKEDAIVAWNKRLKEDEHEGRT